MPSNNEKWHWQTGKAWYGVGIYHVTLTVPSREPLLGELVIPENDPAKAWVQRTKLGDEVTEEALRINHYYPDIRVIQHSLMPDHLHVIYYVTKPQTKSIKTIIRGLWQGVKKIGREYTISKETPLIPSELNSDKMAGDISVTHLHGDAVHPPDVATRAVTGDDSLCADESPAPRDQAPHAGILPCTRGYRDSRTEVPRYRQCGSFTGLRIYTCTCS